MEKNTLKIDAWMEYMQIMYEMKNNKITLSSIAQQYFIKHNRIITYSYVARVVKDISNKKWIIITKNGRQNIIKINIKYLDIFEAINLLYKNINVTI